MVRAGLAWFVRSQAGTPLSEYFRKPLMLTRTEHLDDDSVRTSIWLRCARVNKAKAASAHSSYASKSLGAGNLSSIGERMLRGALAHEYATQAALERAARKYGFS